MNKILSIKKIEFDIYKYKLNGLYIVEVEFDNLSDCNEFIPESWYDYEVTDNTEFIIKFFFLIILIIMIKY
jgi:CYTH domain-containing protein